jgi:hypothetical protein
VRNYLKGHEEMAAVAAEREGLVEKLDLWREGSP